MARLRVFSGQEVCRIPGIHGFVDVRRRGSHVAMQKSSAGDTVTVPVPDHRELRTGTLLSIIRSCLRGSVLGWPRSGAGRVDESGAAWPRP